MAAPAYTTDLTTIIDFDNDTPTVAEPTGWTAGRSPAEDDADFPIQGTVHGSLTMNTTGKAGMVATGPTRTWTSGDYLFGWLTWLAPGAISTQALGGLVMIAGSSSSVQKVFYVGGNDFGSYPYGGWQNFAVDPELTADETNGTATDFYVVGGGANVLSTVSKGNPLGMDVFRYGRGEIRVAAGETANYANFAGMAAANDANTERWGLFQAIESGYKSKGLMVLGYAALVDFVDSNVNIVIDNTEWVQSDFNAIEVRNASSVVDWTSVTIQSLSTTSPGTFTVVDNATVTLTSCTFIDMGAFSFLSNTTVSSAFRGCGQITHGGANVTDSFISGYEGTAGTAALLYDIATDPNGEMDDIEFVMGTALTHAVQFDSNTPSTISLSGHIYTGYNTSTGSNPTANTGPNDAAIYNNTGAALTINIVGGGALPSVRNGANSTTTVVLSKNYTLTGVANPSEVTILDRDVVAFESAGTATTIAFGEALATQARGQEFNGPSSKVERIRIRLRKVGTPTDGVYIGLVLDDSIGIGYDTITQTLDAVDITTAFVEYDFDLQGKWDLTGLGSAFGIQRTGTVDASHYYEIEYSTADIITGTALVNNNGTWSVATGDLLFKAMEAASDNELYHVESVTTGTTSYSHGGTAKTIEVLVASLNYKQVILVDTIDANDKSVPILQIPDLVYSG
jgi:hypothetical protein